MPFAKQDYEKTNVAFLRASFLPPSEKAIYNEIIFLRQYSNYNPLIFTTNIRHKESLDDTGEISEDRFFDKDKLEIYTMPNFAPLYSEKFPFIKNKDVQLYHDFIGYCLDLIDEKEIKLLHAQFGTDALFFLPLKRRTGLPFIVSFRGYDVSRFSKSNPGIYAPLFREADLFLVRSESMKKDIIHLGCSKNKILVHHSATDTQKLKLTKRKILKKGTVKLLFTGRLSEEKGIAYAIKAFAQVIKKHKNLRFKIIGSGPLKNQISELIKNLGLIDCISIEDWQTYDEIKNELHNSHVFIMPSISFNSKEGIPNSLIEAMSTGMPVISTYHGGIPELIENGKNGFLVKEKDIGGLAKKIQFLVENPAIWDKIGLEGRKTVIKDFDIRTQTKKLEGIYDSLIYKIPYSLDLMVEPTNRCNLRCIDCPVNLGSRQKRDMSLAEFKSIISKNKKHIGRLRLWSFGEPLLNRDIWGMVKYAKEQGIKYVKISTNGLLLNEREIEKLILSKLDYLTISLDGATEETYKKFRRGGDFHKLIDNIKLLMEKRNISHSNLKVETQFIVTKYNEHEIEAIKKLSKELGVDYLRLKTMNLFDKKDRKILPRNPEYNRYSIKKKYRTCRDPLKEIVIKSDGSIVPCCHVTGKEADKFVLGNIFNENLGSFLKGKSYGDFVKKCTNDKSKLSCCKNCDAGNLKIELAKFSLNGVGNESLSYNL